MTLKEKEQEFYKVQENWNLYHRKEDSDKLFFYIYDAVSAAIKQKLIGITRNDVDDLIMNATLTVFARYKKDKPYYLSHLLTGAHYAALGVLYNDKQKFDDGLLALDDFYSI